MMKVSVRGGFSDRMGIKPENVSLQYDDFDRRSRVEMDNAINQLFDIIYLYCIDSVVQAFYRAVLSQVYTQIIDFGYRYNKRDVFEYIDDTILSSSYDDVLTLIEFVCGYFEKDNLSFSSYKFMNDVFKKEFVGYRFVNGYIEQIIDENEIKEIEEALEDDAVKVHLNKALGLLGDRENPDYENSIKESISAVEAKCSKIIDGKGSLGDLLNLFDKKGVYINPALKEAFKKLYGYASEAKGVRHAGDIGGPSSTFAEAKFMLVACSAFVNYLKEVYV